LKTIENKELYKDNNEENRKPKQDLVEIIC